MVEQLAINRFFTSYSLEISTYILIFNTQGVFKTTHNNIT